MSISTTTNRVSYAGDGSTKVFPYNFLILANTDLEVIETVTATGVETIKTLTTHYTVSGAGTGSGNVTMVTAPASGTTLTIRRKMPRTQLVDYVENDSFPAATHEQALDKLTMIAQELDQTVKRSLRQPEGDSADIDYLPAKSQRASKYLAFDANGDPIATAGTTEANPVSAFMATVLDDASAAAARATLDVPSTGEALLKTGGIMSGSLQVNGGHIITAVQTIAFNATLVIDAALGNYFEVGALTGNVTSFTINNPSGGQTITIRFKQDATGNRTVANPSGAKINSTIAPFANQPSYLTLTYTAADARWEGAWQGVPA